MKEETVEIMIPAEMYSELKACGDPDVIGSQAIESYIQHVMSTHLR